ncbi:hypothetical protein Pla175_01270 [Pirellulimonas nuda]|uniref:DUF4148 domain-containing protein n=1 Tax=Pirellulimonas nuda TaxID=2528009 RepID=A0A518D5M3_9BACT|nr:hypothetical protein [Pirellulimonas nuda]QDU86777.1 hypothetical protein Pla175_01270 [Pirellulimonas nuda]
MKTYYCAALTLAAICFTGAASGQGIVDFDVRQPEAEAARNDSYQYGYRADPTPRQIMQAKSQQRAAERMARMASLEWYGLSVARPAASPTPFTGSSNRGWQTPMWRGSGFGTTVVIVR